MKLRALADPILVADPTLEGLRMATRATLSAALAAGGTVLLAAPLALPPTTMLLAGALAMMASFLVKDVDVRAQRLTGALMPLAAAFGLCLGTVLAHPLWLSVAGFTATLFCAVAAARWGPRAGALGAMAQNAYFFALFFNAPLAQLPKLLAGVVVGCAAAWVVRFVVVRDSPAATARHQRRAFSAALRGVLSASAVLIEQATTSRARRHDAALAALNRVALTVDVTASPALAAEVFGVEVAAGRVAALSRSAATSNELDAQGRSTLARALRLARDDVPGALALLEAFPGPAPRRLPRIVRALEHLRDALDPGTSTTTLPVEDAPAPAPARLPGLDPDLRRAIQAALAAVLAMLAGFVVSPERWAWAVIAAYVVLMGTATRGDTVVKAAHRVGGTVAGGVVGMVAWHAVAGHRVLALALLFASLFLAFAMMRVAYAWFSFWFAALFALLYGMLGRLSLSVLELRVEETLVGALIGAAVSLWVLPMRTREKLQASAEELRTELGAFVARVLRGDVVDVSRRARALDQRVATLRALAAPLSAPGLAPETGTLVGGLANAVLVARHLARPDVQAELLSLPAELRTALADGERARELLDRREEPAVALFWLRALGDALESSKRDGAAK
jgi:uncharacterized membrane protein YccC